MHLTAFGSAGTKTLLAAIAAAILACAAGGVQVERGPRQRSPVAGLPVAVTEGHSAPGPLAMGRDVEATLHEARARLSP